MQATLIPRCDLGKHNNNQPFLFSTALLPARTAKNKTRGSQIGSRDFYREATRKILILDFNYFWDKIDKIRGGFKVMTFFWSPHNLWDNIITRGPRTTKFVNHWIRQFMVMHKSACRNFPGRKQKVF